LAPLSSFFQIVPDYAKLPMVDDGLGVDSSYMGPEELEKVLRRYIIASMLILIITAVFVSN
jgi:hypothetical protein